MFLNKYYFLIIYIFIINLNIFPQTSITINEYGAYFVNNGEVIKIPTTLNISGGRTWRNYIILETDTGQRIIFNIENGALSDILYNKSTSRGSLGYFPLRSSNNNLLFYIFGTEYELHPVSLRTIRTREWRNNEDLLNAHTYLRNSDENTLFWWTPEPYIKYDYINNDHHRLYFNNTDYIDIIISPNISSGNSYLTRISNSKKQFVFAHNNTNYRD